jgi:hypothetical protein
MPLLGNRFLNATNFISRPALRGKLLNLHFRESAAAAAQSQCTKESKLESNRKRESYPKTFGSIPLRRAKGGHWLSVSHGVENTAIWVYRDYDFTQNVSHVGENEASEEYVVSVFKESKNEPVPAFPSHVFQNNFSIILTPTIDSRERSLCFKFSSQKFV